MPVTFLFRLTFLLGVCPYIFDRVFCVSFFLCFTCYFSYIFARFTVCANRMFAHVFRVRFHGWMKYTTAAHFKKKNEVGGLTAWGGCRSEGGGVRGGELVVNRLRWRRSDER